MTSEYEVRLRGATSATLVEALCADHDLKAETVLHGAIEDQAAFHGLLDRIRDLGLEVIDVHQVSNPNPRSPVDRESPPAG